MNQLPRWAHFMPRTVPTAPRRREYHSGGLGHVPARPIGGVPRVIAHGRSVSPTIGPVRLIRMSGTASTLAEARNKPRLMVGEMAVHTMRTMTLDPQIGGCVNDQHQESPFTRPLGRGRVDPSLDARRGSARSRVPTVRYVSAFTAVGCSAPPGMKYTSSTLSSRAMRPW